MSEDGLSESQDMIEKMPELYAPCDCQNEYPNGWAKLTIDMSLMSEENRQKVYQAERLLREVGIGFDTGSGCGGRDWELDWSLSGARIKIRPLKCMNTECSNIPDKWVWTHWRHGEQVLYPYCSKNCLDEVKSFYESSGWELVFADYVGGSGNT